jgi:hypothetical protein
LNIYSFLSANLFTFNVPQNATKKIMNTAVWVLQGVLAVFFIMPGVGKISGSREKHIADEHNKPDGNLLPIRILDVL